jgi:hypothetical protein
MSNAVGAVVTFNILVACRNTAASSLLSLYILYMYNKVTWHAERERKKEKKPLKSIKKTVNTLITFCCSCP